MDNNYKYMLCLDKNYDVILENNERLTIGTLESIIDNLVYLLQSYGVEDAEIIETIEDNGSVEVIEREEY